MEQTAESHESHNTGATEFIIFLLTSDLSRSVARQSNFQFFPMALRSKRRVVYDAILGNRYEDRE